MVKAETAYIGMRLKDSYGVEMEVSSIDQKGELYADEAILWCFDVNDPVNETEGVYTKPYREHELFYGASAPCSSKGF